MRLLIPVLSLLALAACVSTTKLDIGGQQVVLTEAELKQDLRGRRVVDMTGIQPYPIWEGWSQEIEERMTMGGEQVASGLCGGQVELVSLTRHTFTKRAADLRYRCL